MKEYREITVLSLVVGVLIGAILVASITYSGLVIGFTIVGSTISAILRSRNDFAARSTADAAAFSQDSLLVPTSSMIL